MPASNSFLCAARALTSGAAGRLAALPMLLVAMALPVLAAAEATAPDAASPRVEAELDRADDRRIQERLTATYDALPSLAAVEPKVIAGVVVLRGTVPSSEAASLAGRLAEQVKGVAAVEDQIDVDRSIRGRLNAQLARAEDLGSELLFGLPLLVLAVLVFSLVAWLGKRLARTRRLFAATTDNVFLQDLMRQIVQVAALLLGLLLALDLLDATAWLGGALGAAGVVGLAIGFAFRDLVENYMASVLLSLRQPFLPHDHVRIESYEGKVVRLTWRSTILLTFDGNQVRIPNSVVFKSVVENFSQQPERRLQFDVGVGSEEDLTAVQALAVRILGDVDGILADPPPQALVQELGDWAVVLRCSGWMDTRETDFGKVRSQAIKLVKEAFDEAGISMPLPQQRLEVLQADASAGEPPPAPTRQQPSQLPPPVAAPDITPNRHLDEKVDHERARGDGKDLLQGRGKLD
ncbi:MAG: mechanosensitive ion channel [Gammaproteobacteria bacterium]|nr:mechanosensitive ion channel [Gammaproteobacteria bacterium]